MRDLSRQVAYDELEGGFWLPMGLRLFDRDPYQPQARINVSTVLLDGAHKEDPLRLIGPETGYETAVFFEGCSFFALHTRRYRSRRAALAGHREVVAGLRAKTLPLAIEVKNYYVAEDQTRNPAVA